LILGLSLYVLRHLYHYRFQSDANDAYSQLHNPTGSESLIERNSNPHRVKREGDPNVPDVPDWCWQTEALLLLSAALFLSYGVLLGAGIYELNLGTAGLEVNPLSMSPFSFILYHI